MFDFGKLIQDFISKAMLALGAALGAFGGATSEQTTAITGGLVALAGIVLNMFTNSRTRKDIAVVSAANDTAKTTASIVANEVELTPVGAKRFDAVVGSTTVGSGFKK